MQHAQRKTQASLILAAVVTAVLGTGAASRAVPVTPRAVGLADNALPLSFGLEALTENPAALAVGKAGWWELRLFNISTGVSSNALGMGDYRMYNGATLSAADKADILAKIPRDGWRLGAHAEVSAAAVRLGPFGARLSGFGTARGNIDREILEILFYGNEKDHHYASDLNSGEALAAAALSLSYGTRLSHYKGHPIYGGLTVRLFRGLYYAELAQANGTMISELSGVSGSGYAKATIARGGTGFGLNWGGMMTIGPRYVLSVVLENAPGFIRWSTDAETKSYSILFEGITAENFEDSLWVDQETTAPLSSFNRSLPTRLRLGFGRIGKRLNSAVVLSFGFSDRLAASTTPELGWGAEYILLKFLPLRAGFTVGGLNGFSIGLGSGLHLGVWHLEIALRTAGGVRPTHGRGVTLSLASGLHF